MSKQTAVQMLFDYIEANMHEDNFGLLSAKQTALAMEKEQMIESYCQGCLDISNNENIFPRETSEDYYQATYGACEE